MEDFSKESRAFAGTDNVKQGGIDEKGFILFGHIIQIFVLLVFVTAIGGGLYWSLNKAKHTEADLELAEELLYVMERITDDIQYADKAEIYAKEGSEGVRIYYRTSPEGELTKIYYGRAKSPKGAVYRIFAHDEKGPVTGDSLLGKVNITNFKIKKLSAHVVSIELAGESPKSQYEITTAAYVQGEIIEK